MYFVSLRLTVYLRRILEVKEYSKGKKLVKCYDGINVKEIAFGNKEHTTDSKIGVSVLLRLFISSSDVCNTAYAL